MRDSKIEPAGAHQARMLSAILSLVANLENNFKIVKKKNREFFLLFYVDWERSMNELLLFCTHGSNFDSQMALNTIFFLNSESTFHGSVHNREPHPLMEKKKRKS